MSKEALSNFIIELSKSQKKRDAFKKDPEGEMAGWDLAPEEKRALLDVLNAGNVFTNAQKKLEDLQGAPLPVDDAIIDRLQRTIAPEKERMGRRKKRPAKKKKKTTLKKKK
jgi:hypothetical protein